MKSPNIIERAKEEIQAIAHSPKHHKETHGTSEDIDEDTPVNEVKGPNVFERVKEEVEAIIGAVLGLLFATFTKSPNCVT